MGICTSNCFHVLTNEDVYPPSSLTTPISSTVGKTSAASRPHPRSVLHKSLPSKYEVHRVVKVYDGDTLTLENKSRVRLLGIDTPEIRPKQPYAEEAKNVLIKYCLDQSVYLSFEGDKTDRYGRTLAWVWVQVRAVNNRQNKMVQAAGGYLNVSEEQLASGLATVYNPAKVPFRNKQKLLAYQATARKERIGQWTEFSNSKVLKTKNGRCYHQDEHCTFLARSKHLIVQKSGYRPLFFRPKKISMIGKYDDRQG